MSLNAKEEAEWIFSQTGKYPALIGLDFMNHTRSYSWFDKSVLINEAKNWYKGNGLVAICWHWRDPSRLTDEFYTSKTSFDISKITETTSAEYQAMLGDIDIIAGYLKQLNDAHIPVLFRPLHEASGGWFWWGAKGPEPFKRLWRLMHQRFTEKHRLHNLIWVLSNGPSDRAWYPGDDVVDIIGWDQYKTGGTRAAVGAAEWEALVVETGGRKLLAMTENGTVPSPDDMRALQARWLWFCTWGGLIGDPKWNTSEGIARAFQDEDSIVLGNLRQHGWQRLVADMAPGRGQ